MGVRGEPVGWFCRCGRVVLSARTLAMRYLWCWLFPPAAMVICGRPFSAIFNLVLCCTGVGIPFAMYWAWQVASDFYADKRQDRLISALGRQQQQVSVHVGQPPSVPHDRPATSPRQIRQR